MREHGEQPDAMRRRRPKGRPTDGRTPASSASDAGLINLQRLAGNKAAETLVREGEPAAVRVQRAPTKASAPKLPASWKKKIEEFKHAKAQPQEPVDPAKLEHDYTNALDYINDFYGNSLKCLRLRAAGREPAIGTFTRTMLVPDAPDVMKEVILTIVGIGFNAVGGWNLIEQGMTKGIFATNVWNMERSLGEKIGTVGMAKLKALGPGERDELLGKFLTERAKEGVEGGKTAHEVGEKSEGGSSVGETVGTANKAAEKSLLDWGTYSATALQEKQIAKNHLKQLYDGHATAWGRHARVAGQEHPRPDPRRAGGRQACARDGAQGGTRALQGALQRRAHAVYPGDQGR